jgi:hypothetical protein
VSGRETAGGPFVVAQCIVWHGVPRVDSGISHPRHALHISGGVLLAREVLLYTSKKEGIPKLLCVHECFSCLLILTATLENRTPWRPFILHFLIYACLCIGLPVQENNISFPGAAIAMTFAVTLVTLLPHAVRVHMKNKTWRRLNRFTKVRSRQDWNDGCGLLRLLDPLQEKQSTQGSWRYHWGYLQIYLRRPSADDSPRMVGLSWWQSNVAAVERFLLGFKCIFLYVN